MPGAQEAGRSLLIGIDAQEFEAQGAADTLSMQNFADLYTALDETTKTKPVA